MTVYSPSPHPDFSWPSIHLAVEAERTSAAGLELSFAISGDIGSIIVPDPAEPAFADELWRSTCLEAFAAAPGSTSYVELNFAPSMQWAAYGFTGYREGMAPLRDLHPVLALSATETEIVLGASLELPALAHIPVWQLALAAVVEAIDGSRSYWALAHAPGRPDFHNRDCFIAILAAPDAA